MMSHHAASGPARPAGAAPDRLLRLSMKLDAVATGAVGALALVASPVLDGLLGTPVALLLPVGLFLVAYAAAIWAAGSRPAVSRRAVGMAMAINLLWVIASGALVAAAPFSLTTPGIAFVLFQAAAVALFADLQFLALRQARPAAR